MDYTERLTLSYYKTIAVLNEAHQVFLVQHRQTDQICVKKVLSIYNPEIFRFLREHPIPGTPGILALWEEDGMLTVLEEYISGITLEERMRNAPLTPEEVLSYFSELCDIAERLHQCKPPIIPRDIKPSNIMLTSCGHLVLLDFNAAKSFHRPAAADTTRLGTQGYAAPEQYGFGASSPQTDLYAMGVLLREMSQSFADTAAGRHFLAIAARCTRLNPDERFASAEELKKAGLKTDYRKCDVSNLEQVQQMVDDVVKTYGKIDILHNNAGVNRRVKFEDMDTKTRDFIIGVNILGVWNVARAVWPYMLKANYGRIINTSSVTGVKVVDEGQTTYALTKGAVLGFTKALAYEGGPHGITVNAILPGWVRTPKVEQVCRDSRPEDPESAMRDMAAFIPLKRLCNIDEIGDLVAFLASDDSKYITGTEQVIDGGSTLPETFDILHA